MRLFSWFAYSLVRVLSPSFSFPLPFPFPSSGATTTSGLTSLFGLADLGRFPCAVGGIASVDVDATGSDGAGGGAPVLNRKPFGLLPPDGGSAFVERGGGREGAGCGGWERRSAADVDFAGERELMMVGGEEALGARSPIFGRASREDLASKRVPLPRWDKDKYLSNTGYIVSEVFWYFLPFRGVFGSHGVALGRQRRRWRRPISVGARCPAQRGIWIPKSFTGFFSRAEYYFQCLDASYALRGN